MFLYLFQDARLAGLKPPLPGVCQPGGTVGLRTGALFPRGPFPRRPRYLTTLAGDRATRLRCRLGLHPWLLRRPTRLQSGNLKSDLGCLISRSSSLWQDDGGWHCSGQQMFSGWSCGISGQYPSSLGVSFPGK